MKNHGRNVKNTENTGSCRACKPDLTEEEKLNAIIEAGMYAATGMGKQSPVIIAATMTDNR